MAKRYTVFTAAVSYKPEYQPTVKEVGGETPVYLRRVNANSRTEALEKCLPDIRKELHKVRGKYLSVHVGETCNPSAWACRLTPIQIVVDTGELR